MKKSLVYIVIIAVLAASAVFYWHRARALSQRLGLIQKRAEESKKKIIIKKKAYRAKIAIVIDDFGYNMNNTGEIWQLGFPVTLSVLPNLNYSRRIAEAARKKGFEVILHLPMEPYEETRLEKGTIMASMTDEEIAASFETAVSGVPGLKGVSNHMGSKATEDERVMSVIFKRMKKKKLYFLDSLVTGRSVCEALSRKLGVRFAKRSVFLDNEPDAGYIRKKLEELAKEALGAGWAIGIGHDRPLTIAVIKQMNARFEELGIETVFVSELVR